MLPRGGRFISTARAHESARSVRITEAYNRILKSMQPTLDLEVFRTVAVQLMTHNSVELAGKTVRVGRTGALRLRTAAFAANGREYQAIEQNPDKPSRWGELARGGHQVVQFKDVATNRFVAVAVDGEIKEYSRLSKKK